MSTPLKVLGTAGSLRKGWYNRAALRAAQELAPEGAVIETVALDGISAFNQNETGIHLRMRRDSLTAAEAGDRVTRGMEVGGAKRGNGRGR